jgi:hypothetical protein
VTRALAERLMRAAEDVDSREAAAVMQEAAEHLLAMHVEPIRDVSPHAAPMQLRCAVCGHQYEGPHLPMPLSAAGAILMRTVCPRCASGAIRAA